MTFEGNAWKDKVSGSPQKLVALNARQNEVLYEQDRWRPHKPSQQIDPFITLSLITYKNKLLIVRNKMCSCVLLISSDDLYPGETWCFHNNHIKMKWQTRSGSQNGWDANLFGDTQIISHITCKYMCNSISINTRHPMCKLSKSNLIGSIAITGEHGGVVARSKVPL